MVGMRSNSWQQICPSDLRQISAFSKPQHSSSSFKQRKSSLKSVSGQRLTVSGGQQRPPTHLRFSAQQLVEHVTLKNVSASHARARDATRHASPLTGPFGTPWQSRHERPSPPHRSHRSYTFGPFATPAQSRHVDPSPPHTSHTPYVDEPLGTPAQSTHVDPSPAQTSLGFLLLN